MAARNMEISRPGSRRGVVGAGVFGTALTIPLAGSVAWAAPTCACGGASPPASPGPVKAGEHLARAPAEATTPAPAHPPAPAPAEPAAPPMPDVRGMTPDAAERWLADADPPAPEPPPAAPAPPAAAPPEPSSAAQPPAEPPAAAPDPSSAAPTAPEPPPPAPAPPVTPPSPDVRGMTPDAAERWLDEAPAPPPAPAPPVAPPSPDVRGMTPDAAERWLDGAQPAPAPAPAPAAAPPSPDVRGMTPDAAERRLEDAEEAEPQLYGVDAAFYRRLPPEDQAAIREGHEVRQREERFDPPPGCLPVQGPYQSEAGRPCAFPDGRTIPTSSIGSQPEEARPCVPLQGPYPSEADRPCAFSDGREIPAHKVIQAPPPVADTCEPVAGSYDDDESPLCVYPDGRTSSSGDPDRAPAPPPSSYEELAQGGRGELVNDLQSPTDSDFRDLVDEGTIDRDDFTNRSYFPVEPAPGDGIVVVDFFIPQSRSVFLKGDDRELEDPLQSDLELTDSRVTVVLDRENGRGVITQSGTCTVGISVCQDPRPVELGPEQNREQAYPNDPNEFDLRADGQTISLSYDVLNSITPEAFSVDGTVRLERRPDGLYQVVHDTRDNYPAISIWQYRPGDSPRLIDYDRGEHVLRGAVPDCDLPDLPDGPNLPNIGEFNPPGTALDFLRFDGPDLPDLPNAPNLPNVGSVYGVCR